MAQFRNIQDNGNWYRGNTYTFEVLLESQIDSRDDGYASGWDDVFVTDIVIPENTQPGEAPIYLGHWACVSGLGGNGPTASVGGPENSNPCPFPNPLDLPQYTGGIPGGGYASQSYDPGGNIVVKNGAGVVGTQIISSDFVDENFDWQRVTVAIPSDAPLGDATIATAQVFYLNQIG